MAVVFREVQGAEKALAVLQACEAEVKPAGQAAENALADLLAREPADQAADLLAPEPAGQAADLPPWVLTTNLTFRC